MIAALSLVFQQQATLASFIDAEYGKATFTAATLTAIEPTTTAKAASIDVSWNAADGSWATPSYALNESASGSGNGSSLYTGPGTSYTHDLGTGSQSDTDLNFTDVSAGATHTCGVARGNVYCWGTNSAGLGTGSTVSNTPAIVNGFSGKTVTDVTAGTNFSCAIASGTVYCWGLGVSGQLGNGGTTSATPVAVGGLSGKTITSISAGASHACAVANGAAYCWGLNSSGQVGDNTLVQKSTATAASPSGVLSGRTVSRISAGGTHTCAVADGLAFCWGANGSGRLGNNSTTASRVPVAVTTTGVLNGRTVSAISAGGSHTCAIADGKAYCWGFGTSGQLGNSGSSSQVPVAVTTTTMTAGVSAVSAGNTHTCAVSSGDVYCWGAGANNALGNGGTANQSAPVAVTGSLNGSTRTLSAGSSFACATGNSVASCWGFGSSGQLGDGATTNNPVPAHAVMTDKACPDGSVRTSSSTCSLVQGTDYYYRLGHSIGSWAAPNSAWVKETTKTRSGVDPSADGTTATSISLKWNAASEAGSAFPEYTLQRSTSSDGSNAVTLAVNGSRTFTDFGGVGQSRDFSQLSAGGAHTCGIIGSQLYCWGSNTNGQLGIGSTTDALEPTLVTGLVGKTVTMVSAGASHTCAVADDKAYCWGLNTNGQLGDGTTGQKTSPQLIPNQDGYTVTAVSAGAAHSCGVGGGVVYCWGLNANGQLGNGNNTQQLIPTQVANSAVFTNGSATRVSAGGSHTCAVSGSRAYCWGLNTNGQLGNGQTTPSTTAVAVSTTSGQLLAQTVTEVSAGTSHSCVVAASKAYCWGQSGNGQVGNGGTGGTNSVPMGVYTGGGFSGSVTAISAGNAHTCAVAGGASYCWGIGTNGQLGNGGTAQSAIPVPVTPSGAFGTATTDIAVGNSHSCSISDGAIYCWGLGTNGRLGVGGAATTGNFTTAQRTVTDARCAAGSTALGNGTCSLKPNTTYYYRVKFTLDGNTATTGDWTGIKTS